MGNEILKRDDDRTTVLGGVTDDSNQYITQLRVDPVTGRLKVSATVAISGIFQTDVFTSSNNQTVFTASLNVAYTIGLYIQGSLQTPNVDYTVSGGVATLSNGIPSGNMVVWIYTTS